MRYLEWAATCAALLAVMAALTGSPRASLADGQPDLKVEYLGMDTTTPNQFTLAFEVTNVGAVDSAATVATIQTIAPPPPNPETINLPALRPGTTLALTYTLAAPCASDQVQVTVAQDNDANPADNTLQVSPCLVPVGPLGVRVNQPFEVPTPIAAPNHSVVGTLQCMTVDPYTCPGVHTIDLARSAQWTARQGNDAACHFTPTRSPDGSVGWYQSGDCNVEADQTAVTFDLSELDKIPGRLIASARLGFAEQEQSWRDTDGNHRDVDGCVAAVGVATEDWPTLHPDGRLIANDVYQDYSPGNVHEFEVTVPFAQQLANQTPRWGFVLHGAVESLDTLEHLGQSSCMSTISNPVLHVTYVVPD